MSEKIIWTEENHIATITFNLPKTLNALDENMASEFNAVIKAKLNKNLRAVILTGTGKAFSAGGNLEMLKDKSKLSCEENRLKMLKFYDSFLSIRSYNIPLIAALNGHAIGAGLCLACACDIRISVPGAKLGVTFTKLGLHPGMGATFLLAKIIGKAKASELLLTARTINAKEAFELGLLSKIVEDDKLISAAKEIANEIATCGKEATRQLTESLRSDLPSLSDSLNREALCQSTNYVSNEFKEGINAIIEKRKPKF